MTVQIFRKISFLLGLVGILADFPKEKAHMLRPKQIQFSTFQ